MSYVTYFDYSYSSSKKLNPKHGNWSLFTLDGTLTAVKYPFPDLHFLRPFLWKPATVDMDPGVVFRNQTASFLGIGSFTELGDNQIPKSDLHGRKEFVNSMMDSVGTAARNSKRFFAENMNDNVSLFDTIPMWAAATVLQVGYLMDGGKVFYPKTSLSRVKLLLPQISFEELLLFSAAKRLDEAEIWLPYLQELKTNPDFSFDLRKLQQFLNEGVAAEDSFTFMKVPEVWLDELLQA